MSRSGYSDQCDGWALVRWRGAVAQSARGKRGQAMLKEMAIALDSLPEKRLAANSLETSDGEYCALGALGRYRGMDMKTISPDDREAVAKAFGVAEALASEVMFLNDEAGLEEDTPFNFLVCGPMRPWQNHTQLRWMPNEQAGTARWKRMRAWVAENIY
jgi:hypothetical protein